MYSRRDGREQEKGLGPGAFVKCGWECREKVGVQC